MNEEILELECPHCHAAQRVSVPTTVHKLDDPDAYRRILDGTLFEYTCPHCGGKMHVTFGVMFHDPEKRILCFYCPDPNQVKEVMGMFEEKPAGYTVRITEDEGRFLEKIRAFEQGYDDKALEMWKLTYLYRIVSHHEDFEADDALYGYRDGAHKIDFYKEGRYIGSVDADPALIPGVKERFLSRDTGVVQDDLFVDIGWAMEHLTNLLHRPDSAS